MLNLYKMPDNTDFLCYGEEMKFPNEFGIELIKENVDLSDYMSLPVMSHDQLVVRIFVKGTRTPDKILSENNIESFDDLSFAHFCIMQKISSFPKRVRDLIEQKYADLLEYYHPKETEEWQ